MCEKGFRLPNGADPTTEGIKLAHNCGDRCFDLTTRIRDAWHGAVHQKRETNSDT